MNAIILAAGQGIRLQPLTNDKPKGMVQLFGKSLLEWQINTLTNCGIKDITIVTGYMSEQINFKNIFYKKNPNFQTTNMVETLFCAKDKLLDSTIISYGDIIYQKDVLQKLIDSPHEISVIIDKNWESYWDSRFSNPLSDAESLKIDDSKNIIEIGKKTNSLNEICGQYIGLMKFQGDGTKNLKFFYEDMVKKDTSQKNPLNPNCKFEESYMTDLLQGMIDSGIIIKGIETKNGWLELDSFSDYLLYEKMEKENTLKQFFDIKKLITK